MENPTLPSDLMVEILLRLPVKFLLRFKCMCKSWLSVISDPQFAKSHFDLAAAVTHRVLLGKKWSCSSEIVSMDVEGSLFDYSAAVFLRLPPPAPDRSTHVRIWGSCRGFIFLAHEMFITVWNPSTGAHGKIPVFNAKLEDDLSNPVHKGFTVYGGHSLMFDSLHGVGYDESNDDYLIVIIQFGGPQIQVFSLKTNVTSFIHGVDVQYLDMGYHFRAGILLNESLHWLVASSLTNLPVVIAFDLVDKSLSEIPLVPDLAAELACKQYLLGVMGGSLCLCDIGRGDTYEKAQIWVMKEYKMPSSWTKSFVLQVTSVLYNHFFPAWFTRCGGIFGSSGSRGLMKFDDKGNNVEFRTYSPYENGFIKHHDLYRESLLSLPSEVDEAK